jgi:ketosteroid isomerase-like protein
MEESQELKDLIFEAANANKEGNFEFWEKHFSKNMNVMTYGTAPSEGINGYEKIIATTKAELSAMKPTSITIHDMQAFSEGSVGWFLVRSTGFYSNGTELPLRTSGVVHKEDGIWKIVMQNTTLEVPDEKIKAILDKWYF